MAERLRAIAGAALLLGAALTAGCDSTANPGAAENKFLENQQIRGLTVQVETLKAKLDKEREETVRANHRADQAQRELAIVRQTVEEERVTYNLALKLIEDQKAKLELLHSEAGALKTLREDVIRLSNMIKERDAEIARLRAQLEKPGRRADGTAP